MAKIRLNGQLIEIPDATLNLPPAERDAAIDDIANDIATRQEQQQQREMAQNMAQIEAYGRHLEGQDIQQNMVQGNNWLQDFGLSAGVQLSKMGLGVKDLVGIGSEENNRLEAGRLEQLNTALAEQSPVANFTGRVTGGAVAAAPVAMAATALPYGAALANAGWTGRTALSGLLGAAEGALEMPFADESRVGNAEMGAVSGLASEPVANALQAVVKRIPFRAILDQFGGQNKAVREQVRNALKEQGIDYNDLKPDTRAIFDSLSRAEDVDAAIKHAVETEYGFKLTQL